MALFGSEYAYSSNQTSTTTNTITDAFNQSASEVRNLSDVGNVNVNFGEEKGDMSPIIIIGIIIAVGLFALKMFKRNH